jgi:heme-degrading monooxygenase HmoA
MTGDQCNRKEGKMAVKIFIKRKVAKDKGKNLALLLTELRTLTMKQSGYISGETLNRFDKPGETLVISTWQSVDEWREWVLSKERCAIQDKIDALLGEKTEYEIYKY